jgi:aryl carrier-like protein
MEMLIVIKIIIKIIRKKKLWKRKKKISNIIVMGMEGIRIMEWKDKISRKIKIM